jgi:hypothetical protein
MDFDFIGFDFLGELKYKKISNSGKMLNVAVWLPGITSYDLPFED